jgi:2-oxoglutarate ferredoxin oxidoreductase subunit beta
MYDYYDKHVYDLKDHNPQDYSQALNKIKEWDYNSEAPIALGNFYRKNAPTFEENLVVADTESGKMDFRIREILKASI